MGLQVIEKTLQIKDIVPNKDNPRIIRDDKYLKLKKSIQDYPEMITIRPLVINEENIILGGNMRYKVMTDLGYTELPVIQVIGLSKEKQNEFIIKDNINYGEWNWQTLLTDEWDTTLLDAWGIEFPEWKGMDELDFDLDNLKEKEKLPKELFTLKSKLDKEDYNTIVNELMDIDKDINIALLKILGLYGTN